MLNNIESRDLSPARAAVVATDEVVTVGEGWTHARCEEANGFIERVAASRAHTIVLTAGTEDSVWPSCAGTTAWWEQQFLERGFRKSTRTPGSPSRLQTEGDQVVRHPIVLERLAPEMLARYPLVELRAERDLHMDMLREAGPRSDAHLARYRWACRFVSRDAVVVDAACGLGYGTAILADTTSLSRVMAVDASAYAIDYCHTAWARTRPHLEFFRRDVRALPAADGAVDLVVSFETLEHLEECGPFLEEISRVLKPGGYLVGSVPNLWVDASGKDPSPYHFQVFDHERLTAGLHPYFTVCELWQQNAGHDRDGAAVLPKFRSIGLDGRGVDGKPEWLIFAARRPSR
jgi:2-polyprenyl-3-methyl-5-hydroxy-6-metoxy-1,4-benzoquinol methylase